MLLTKQVNGVGMRNHREGSHPLVAHESSGLVVLLDSRTGVRRDRVSHGLIRSRGVQFAEVTCTTIVPRFLKPFGDTPRRSRHSTPERSRSTFMNRPSS